MSRKRRNFVINIWKEKWAYFGWNGEILLVHYKLVTWAKEHPHEWGAPWSGHWWRLLRRRPGSVPSPTGEAVSLGPAEAWPGRDPRTAGTPGALGPLPRPRCWSRSLQQRGLLSLTWLMQDLHQPEVKEEGFSYRAVLWEVTEVQTGKHEKKKKEKVRRFQRRGSH